MTGYFRFSYGVSNNEAVLKDGTYAKCTKKVLSGQNSITLDNTLIGIRENSYININDRFYLVSSVDGTTINIYDFFNVDIEEGTMVKLFSNYIEINTDSSCTKFTFVIGNILRYGDYSYTIKEDDTPESVYEELSKVTLITRFGDTYYALGDWIAYYDYETFSSLPIASGFLVVESKDYIVPGDILVLFNEDVRANNTVYVEKVKEEQCASGFKYTIKVSGLSGTFNYAQLRALPAYKSKKLSIQNCKPSIVDICGDTVYGKDVKIVKGIRTYTSEKEITNGFEDLKYLAGFPLEPSDLWLNDVIDGRLVPVLPNVRCITNEDGIFRMYLDSKIPSEFTFVFKSNYQDVKISFMDIDGNILALGTKGDILSSRLNKVTLNIKAEPNAEIDITLFKYIGETIKYIEYYFVCQEMSNERVEVNSIHLNPVFRNYRELLAIVGKHRASEGRIAL
jgi:hypothetical protein